MSVSRRAVLGSLALAMGASFVIARCQSENDQSQIPPTAATTPATAPTTRQQLRHRQTGDEQPLRHRSPRAAAGRDIAET